MRSRFDRFQALLDAGQLVRCQQTCLLKHLRVGDRVMGLALGSFASEVCGDARCFVRIPDALSFSEVPGVSILKYETRGKSLAILASRGTESVTPLKGASWIIIGIFRASESASKCS